MKRLIVFPVVILTLSSSLVVARQYAPQFGAAVAVSENTVFVSEGRNRISAGSVYTYHVNEDGDRVQGPTLTAMDATEMADGFGRAISVSGSELFVGAPIKGAVYVFRIGKDGSWEGKQQLMGGETGFGSTVYASGEHVLIAQSGGREGSDRVFSYRRATDGVWVATGELYIDGIPPGSGFGNALLIDGDIAFVSAPSSVGRTGAVYTFRLDGSAEWVAGEALSFPGVKSGDQFGASLLMANGELFVGSPGVESGTGVVLIYHLDTDTHQWEYERRLGPFDARGGEQFGASIAYTNGQIWVGTPGYGKREGTVYQFEADSYRGRMSGTRLLQPETVQYRSGFGGRIAASEDLAVVGSVGYDNFEGAAFVYAANEGGWKEQEVIINDSGFFESVTGGMVECDENVAGEFQCSDVNLASFLTNTDIGARRGIQVNDVWGWEDPDTGREYAIIGRTDGTSFVDLTDPYNPVYLGNLPLTSTANQALHRDVKVYQHYALVVADGAGAHHMQVFDLHKLRDLTDIPATFEYDALYKGIYSSHNLIVNEEAGFAFAVGSDSGGESCGGALHMIDMADPLNPQFAGCFADTRTGRRGTGSTHDAQCVNYHGPDPDYQGREICLSSNGTAVSIADVTDKKNPVAISLGEYPNVAYTHQGWLTEDHEYFYLNDEGDETSGLVDRTRTLIFDVKDLDEPVIVGEYYAEDNAIDHNLYIKGNLMYQTNYQAGLRILDISNPEKPVEVGYFDTVPYGENNSSGVLGAWSNYPFFKSGVIVVTSGREGVFFLKKKDIDT